MDYYSEIKNELINNEIYKRAKDYSKNRSDLITYYNVGKLLVDAGKHYGEGIISEYSKKLTEELGKGFNCSSLKRCRQFFIIIQKGASLSHHLTWSHYCELMPLKDIDKINYYIKIVEEQNLGVRNLRVKVKNNEYGRLDDLTKNKLINHEENKVEDFIKNPIIVRNKNNIDITRLSEKMLKQLILEDIDNFLDELGNGFTYIRNEYKIKIGDRYNYIDILLFNYIYNCFVVVELKVTELKKENIGQIEIYMNYIDKNVRTINQDKTIGIIICKHDNKFMMEYCSDERVIAKEYELL